MSTAAIRLVCVLGLLGAALLQGPAWAQHDHSAPMAKVAVGTAAPDAALLDQDGRRFTLKDLRGKTVLFAFIYTSCHHVCPLIVESVTATQQRAGKQGMGDVRAVFVTAHPEIDTPQVLKAHAERRGADLSASVFLTGSERELKPGVGRLRHQDQAARPRPCRSSAGRLSRQRQGRLSVGIFYSYRDSRSVPRHYLLEINREIGERHGSCLTVLIRVLTAAQFVLLGSTRGRRVMKLRAVSAWSIVMAALSGPAMAAVMWSTGGDGTQLVKFDTVTGVGTVVGATGQSAGFALAIDPTDGALYTLVNSYADGQLATLNPTTGAATVFGAGNGIADMMVLEIATDGTMYSASWATNSLYRMNKATGVATLIGGLGFGGIMDLAFDTTGQLWATNSGALYKVNTSTGAGTLVAGISGTDGCNMGIAFDSANNLFGTSWCSGNSPFWSFNTTTGAATVINAASGISQPHGGDIANVPEPSSLALLGLGLAYLAAARRRNR